MSAARPTIVIGSFLEAEQAGRIALDPAGMARHSPALRWIQATSAGIGGFMQRTGLDASVLDGSAPRGDLA